MLLPDGNKFSVMTNRINNDSKVASLQSVQKADFDSYVNLLAENGYVKKEEHCRFGNDFIACVKGDDAIFVNYYPSLQEMTIVAENHTRYFDYCDSIGASVSIPQITQLPLEDFGMSYVIHLSDGRFVIIDGGWDFEPDARRLYAHLKRNCTTEKPVIAAWIMTHPHSDHFHCYITFMDLFAKDVVIEKYLLTFPEHDDTSHYPKLIKKDKRFEDSSAFTNIPKMFAHMVQSNAPIYSPHTGQQYRIGDAVFHILGSMDDTIHISDDLNDCSLVIRMELGSQVILWSADAHFSALRLAEKYGHYLKADILQVPHHGFRAGDAQAQIDTYKLIEPSVCLLPVSDFDAYTIICTYHTPSRYLMRYAGVQEIITGDAERTLTLPYVPNPVTKEIYANKYSSGRHAGGATTWVYSELHTDNEEDFQFSILNMTNLPVTVWIELFFENPANAVRFIKASIPRMSLKSIRIDSDDVDGDALYFNPYSLKEKGIPEHVPFAVRFTCESPIVISHKHHSCSYKSPFNP